MKYIFFGIIFFFTSINISNAQEAQDEPPYGMSELEAYSIFIDAYRMDDYELATMYGEWMIEAAPRTIEGYDGFELERQFDRMINVYVSMAEEESDPTEITNLLEEAERILYRAYDVFDEDEIDYFEWYVKHGRFYHENAEHLDADMNDAISYYEQAYESDFDRFVNLNDGFFVQVMLTHYATDGLRDEALAMIDEVEPVAGIQLMNTIDEIRELLFEGPEERIDFIVSRIDDAEAAEKEEMLQDLVDLYEETSQPDKARQAAVELYQLNPDFNNTKNVADIYLGEGNYAEALNYLQESVDLAETDTQKKEVFLEMAETHQQLDDLQSARSYARQALEIDDAFGEAYMRIASIYAAAVTECTGGEALEREDRTVYWLVIEYLERAKEADPSLASTANNRIESYEAAMPSTEDKFFSDWEDGEPFDIDGDLKECYAWINETTTIR